MSVWVQAVPPFALWLALAAALIAVAVLLAQWMHAREMARVAGQRLVAARQEGAEAGERVRALSDDIVSELEAAVARSEGETCDTKAAFRKQAMDLLALDGQTNELLGTIQCIHARCDRAEADRDAFQARAADCQAEVDRAREAIAGLTRERDDIQAEGAMLIQRRAAQVTELKAAVATLTAERDSARAEADRAGQHAAKVERDLEAALAKLAAVGVERGAKGQFVAVAKRRVA